jgi:hypothetical protein
MEMEDLVCGLLDYVILVEPTVSMSSHRYESSRSVRDKGKHLADYILLTLANPD